MFARQAAQVGSERLGRSLKISQSSSSRRARKCEKLKSATVSYEIAVFAVQQTKFARPLRGPSPKSDYVNEENDPPGLRPRRGTQVRSSLKTVNLCIHGLVLLEGLSVAVLIQREVELNSEVELIRRGLILAVSESFA